MESKGMNSGGELEMEFKQGRFELCGIFLMADIDFMVWSFGLRLLILEGRVFEVAKQSMLFSWPCLPLLSNIFIFNKKESRHQKGYLIVAVIQWLKFPILLLTMK